ncbi:hypothetical protein [Apilactobacillus timberlakei]|uniref:hypothetical protein n=1 Tax=Apilactobacillus timberlakei TaxID=2008380 RepID=UPI00112BA9EE|nr:hypothetical protein [Apilactobacillus timberlakei]TPR16711.1 hypothetical protein DYZ95_06955 [Apilactobacillus timberlakei]TPR21573.1 hypothetical protein DY083_06005 [Apilactobacillus timberlakei]
MGIINKYKETKQNIKDGYMQTYNDAKNTGQELGRRRLQSLQSGKDNLSDSTENFKKSFEQAKALPKYKMIIGGIIIFVVLILTIIGAILG